MAYWKDRWDFLNSIDYEYKWNGKYGKKGEKRGKKKKPTKEQIKNQNQRNKEKKIWRILRANFDAGDLWTTLKFPAGTKKTLEELKKTMSNFLLNIRRAYRKIGQQLKYVYRIDIGKKGGIHIHIIIHGARRINTSGLITKYWKKNGHVNFTPLYEEGELKRLAEYIAKPPPQDEECEGYQQISMFDEKEKRAFYTYSCSRNLIQPKPERKTYLTWTVKKIIEEGPKPTPGFYIDQDSLIAGINPYTGMSYLHYTEIRITPLARGGDDG